MASASTMTESIDPSGGPMAALIVTLPPLAPEALEQTLTNLALAFGTHPIRVATPDPLPRGIEEHATLQAITYTPAAPALGGWVLTAADFLNSYKMMEEHGATKCLILGPEAQSLSPEALMSLATPLYGATTDLTVPRYALGPRDGLVNSGILYPATRALFGTKARYPLAIDLAMSRRTAERLAAVAQRFTASGQPGALIWPVAEAASAGFTIAEVDVGSRAIPAPDTVDLNTVLAHVAGSFFADVEAKAGFWQRARLAYSPRAAAAHVQSASVVRDPVDNIGPLDLQPMLESFRLAYSNLHEIWSLVLPPNSLLGLKKLSATQAADFRFPDALWARIVYDFILGYRLRTINRGHLMGALTPLYLAWVASHLGLASSGAPDATAPEAHIELLASAFESEKPYVVSRWRWPDRFNP